jgi:hypothetical protein
MPIEDFIISVFVWVDDTLKALFGSYKPWRTRGPAPRWEDSEVLTMEWVGEFLGYDQDKGIYNYFRQHWLHLFPDLARVHRTRWVRQAARLVWVKERLWRFLRAQVPSDSQVSIIDSFPLYVCEPARAYRVRLFRDEAAWGWDEHRKAPFFGFRWHLRIQWPGVIAEVLIAPANVSDLAMTDFLLEGVRGWVMGDRSYWSPERRKAFSQQGLALLAPPKRREQDASCGWTSWLTQKRRRIETVISQLTERFHAKRTWARDLLHLALRIFRKVLSHTLAVFLNSREGREPLQLSLLVTS